MSEEKKGPSVDELLENGRRWWKDYCMKQAIESYPALADALIGYGMESELTRLDIKNLPESGRVSKSFVSLSGDESVIEVE